MAVLLSLTFARILSSTRLSKRVGARIQECRRDASRVVVSAIGLSRLPTRDTAKVRKAPRLPTDANQFDLQAPGAVTVTLFGLWHRNPESSRTQNNTCI